MATIQRFPCLELDACERALREDGAVCHESLLDAELLSAMVTEHDRLLAEVDVRRASLERREHPYLTGMVNGKCEKTYMKQGWWDLGDSIVLDLGQGRLDFTHGLDDGIFSEERCHAPAPLAELLCRLLKSDYAHYVGAVPSRSESDTGILHRDAYSLFDDDKVDTSLPPFYYTILMPLNDVTEELGPTELHLGSHRCVLEEAKACPTVRACLKAGDALIFDGRLLHRGLANTTSELRRMLYAVWQKKWYNDYSDCSFASGFAVCGA